MKPGYIRPLSSSELIDLPFGLLRDLGWRGVWLHILGLLPWLVATAVLLAPLAAVLPTNMRMFNRLELGMVGEAAWWRWLLWFFSAVLLGFPLAAGTWRTAWHILGVQKNVRQCYAETWRAALQLMPVVLVLQLTLWIGNMFNILPGIGTMFALFAIYPFYIGWSFAIEAVVLEGITGPAALRRGWQLCQTQRARHTWNMVVQGLLLAFVTAVPGFITLFVGEFFIEMGGDAQFLAIYIVSGLCLLALSAWVTCAHVLAYYDLRARREALDIQLDLADGGIKGGVRA